MHVRLMLLALSLHVVLVCCTDLFLLSLQKVSYCELHPVCRAQHSWACVQQNSWTHGSTFQLLMQESCQAHEFMCALKLIFLSATEINITECGH